MGSVGCFCSRILFLINRKGSGMKIQTKEKRKMRLYEIDKPYLIFWLEHGKFPGWHCAVLDFDNFESFVCPESHRIVFNLSRNGFLGLKMVYGLFEIKACIAVIP